MLEIRAEQRPKKVRNTEINILKSAIIKLCCGMAFGKTNSYFCQQTRSQPIEQSGETCVDTVISISDILQTKTNIFNTSRISMKIHYIFNISF